MKIRIEDYELYTEDLGSKTGETIVFLNGVMASTNSWNFYAKWFVEHGYRVILHDFRGQLKSDGIKGVYTFEKHAEDMRFILEHFGVKKAHFIGTSYGGEVGLKFAIKYPEILASLIVIDSVSELDEKLRKEIEIWIDLASKKDGYKFFWGMAKSIYGKKFMQDQMPFLESRAIATSKVDASYFDGQVALYQTFINDVNMTDDLKTIKTPTLIICGEEDDLKPIKFSRIIANEISSSEFVTIPEAGHVVIFEKPNEILTLMIGHTLKNKIESLV